MADRLVIDTSVLVDYRRQAPLAEDYVFPLFKRRVAVVHPVTAAELLDGARDRRDQREVMEFVRAFGRLLLVKSADFERCLAIMAEVRLSHGVGWPDCLIGATCLRLGLPLVTLNDKHFRAIRGLKVVRPY